MNPQRLALVTALSALAMGLASLLSWWLLWRLMLTQPLPDELYIAPLAAFAGVIAALGLLSVRRWAPPWLGRTCAGLLIGIASAVLLEHLLGLSDGLESYFFSQEVKAVLGGTYPGRPAPQAALIFLFLGLALWLVGQPRLRSFGFVDLGIGLALVVSFTTVLGHLYQARELYYAPGSTAGMSLATSLMLLVLSVGALTLNPKGPIALLNARDAAGVARRRLLPVLILTPVLLGLLLLLAVRHAGMDLPLAAALLITITILGFVGVVEWVSRLLRHLQEEQTGVLVLRETRAKEEGMTDILTGLLNRRGWDQAMRRWEDRCQRENLNACVIVIDLDGLKLVNDTQGHAKGDELIRRAGHALRSASRQEDCLARLGGDEFAYLSVGCAPEHAGVVLRRLAASLHASQVPASLGYAMRDLAGSLSAAFQEADKAMYEHKRARKTLATGKATA